mmetsp:Transcript_15789/g.26824  ORF Transcript_15789/g.26824 Transcript_15789/m.26824 type:complete len:226 (-) Transcript_15789:463-1140(-)
MPRRASPRGGQRPRSRGTRARLWRSCRSGRSSSTRRKAKRATTPSPTNSRCCWALAAEAGPLLGGATLGVEKKLLPPPPPWPAALRGEGGRSRCWRSSKTKRAGPRSAKPKKSPKLVGGGPPSPPRAPRRPLRTTCPLQGKRVAGRGRFELLPHLPRKRPLSSSPALRRQPRRRAPSWQHRPKRRHIGSSKSARSQGSNRRGLLLLLLGQGARREGGAQRLGGPT